MIGNVEDRACALGAYLIEHRATVRAAAQKFGISKSTVHKDVTVRLRALDRRMYEQVQALLQENKRERHIRGGAATKQKYADLSRVRNARK